MVVDWGTTGIGVLGDDLAIFVAQPVYWFNGVAPEQWPELDRVAFAGYLQGLRDVGWEGDRALVRLGYVASLALRGGLCILIVEWTARDEALRNWVESAMGHTVEEISKTFRGLREYVVACADEARELMRLPIFTTLPG